MGLDSMDTNPIPHLTSPLKGEEQGKLALMPPWGESRRGATTLRLKNE